MFSEELYHTLKKSSLFKGFILYCFLGGLCFTAIGIFLVSSGKYLQEGILELICVVIGLSCFAVPFALISSAFSQPYLCTEGEITEISKRKATVAIGDESVRGSSFENFLFAKSLDDYTVGDKVLIYSKDKRMSRPLFFHI